MVRGQIVSVKELKESRDRDDILQQRLGLRAGDFQYVRNEPDPEERILRAGKVILARTGDGIAITQYTVDALAEASTYTHGKRMYGMERERFHERHGFSPPYMHFLREEIGAYEGNLPDACRRWEGIKPSVADWQRSVRIPTKIGELESEWLGFVWGDGHMTSSDPHQTTTLIGSTDHIPFYRKAIVPRLKQVHNIEGALSIVEEGTDNRKRLGDYTYNQPVLRVDSRAIATWLLNECGFTRGPRYDTGMPAVRVKTDAFMRGVVATMGSVGETSNGAKVVRFYDKDPALIQGLKKMAAHLDCRVRGPYETTGGTIRKNASHVIEMSRGDVEKNIGLLNPAHAID